MTEENQVVIELSQLIFGNPVIVSAIAEQCTVGELKTLRLINRFCCNESKMVWINKAVVNVAEYTMDGRVTFNDLMTYIRKGNRLFKNIRVHFALLPSKNGDNMTSFCKSVWSKFNSVEYFRLSSCKYDQFSLLNTIYHVGGNASILRLDTIENSRNFSDPFKKVNCWKVQPNLKVLKVYGKLPFPNWNFLRYFPSLKEIELGHYTDGNLITAICFLRRQDKILNISTLTIIRSKQSLEQFVEANLSLVSLSVQIKNNFEGTKFAHILASQSKTIKFMRLFKFPGPNFSPYDNFPFDITFENLCELHLCGAIISNLNLLMYMSMLEKLVIDLRCDANWFRILYLSEQWLEKSTIDIFIGNLITNSNILIATEKFQHSKLNFLQIDYEFDEESIVLLSAWTPALTVFISMMPNETTVSARSFWPALERLEQ